MKTKALSRRSFILSTTVISAGIFNFSKSTLSSFEPFNRKGKSRLLPSLAAYSFRDYFIYGGSKKPLPQEKRIDLFQFIDFCAQNGCVGTELTSYYFPPDVNEDYLLKIKRHAFLNGIAISGTSVGNSFTLPSGDARKREIEKVKKWIDYAAIMGAPHIRVFAGSAGNLPVQEAKKYCIEALNECGDYAGKKGVFLGIENHGGIVAEPEPLIEIVNAVKSDWIGINLDTGNFVTEDPYKDIEKCAPYAVNVQIKVEVRRKNQKQAEPADLERVFNILKKANYQGFVALEYEAAEDPWAAVPRYLKEVARLCSV
ncbi:MAG: sugar phosphate isomerase/epimerase family protein [Verrucomicrobiia bacterium]